MKDKLGNVTSAQVYLQTLAELLVSTLTVLKNYCNSVNGLT